MSRSVSTSSSPEPRASTDSRASIDSNASTSSAWGWASRKSPSPDGSSASPSKTNLSQLRDFLGFLSTVKGDLSNITAPPFVLSTKSVTELPATWAEHQSLFLAPASEPDPALRALAVLKNFICSLKRQTYTGRDESEGVKKPLNAFLGEAFLAKFAALEGKGETKIISEQVSHHPPVTACYLWNEEMGTYAEGCVAQNTTFSASTGVQVKQMGHALITLELPASDESKPQTNGAQAPPKPATTPYDGVTPTPRNPLGRTESKQSYFTPPQTPSGIGLSDPMSSMSLQDSSKPQQDNQPKPAPRQSKKEYHILTLPTLVIRSLLSGRPYPELSSTCSLASSTGYTSRITFSGKSNLGLTGTKNTLHATLSHPDQGDLFEVTGQWTGTLQIHDLRAKSKKLMEEIDIRTLESGTADPVKHIDEQGTWETRRAWSKTIKAIREGDMRGTATEKSRVEEAQRALRKQDLERGIDREKEFERSFFVRDAPVTGDAPDEEELALRELADKVGLSLEEERGKTAGRWRFVGVAEAEERIARGVLHRDGMDI